MRRWCTTPLTSCSKTSRTPYRPHRLQTRRSSHRRRSPRRPKEYAPSSRSASAPAPSTSLLAKIKPKEEAAAILEELARRQHRRRPLQGSSSACGSWKASWQSGNEPRVDDHDRAARAAARPAPAGAAGRRTLRHFGPERSLSPHHQPQQPPQAHRGPARAARS